MTLVSLHHVSVAYDGCEALRDVDLQIDDRDFLGVIGPNGGGKTTLVKAILERCPTRAKSSSRRSSSAARSG